MKRILFVTLSQYGYNTDMYNISKYLTDEYEVFFLCYNRDLKIIPDESVNVTYLSGYEPGMHSKLFLMKKAKEHIKSVKPDITFISYFPGCSFFKLFLSSKKIILDIRTGAIEQNNLKRYIKNFLIRFEANRFGRISVISKSLMELLHLSDKKSFVLPLGADAIVDINKKTAKEGMNVLYVGTFDKRKIEDTIFGFIDFYSKNKNSVSCKYTIIGYSNNKKTEEELIQLIKNIDHDGMIHYLGRIPNYQLKEYFETHNIGVSYIPITKYFNVQPPTKTFEYIRNGLICLATRTYENSKVVNAYNGVLIDEGSSDFAKGLQFIYDNLSSYNRLDIMKTGEHYSWCYIVNNILKKQLQEIL